jgi:hypothetical protein
VCIPPWVFVQLFIAKVTNMPGFVDVSNMTSEQVRRMGHADDYDEEPYQPRQTWQPRAKPEGTKHSVDNVWGAAVAAQRENGGYFKEDQWMPNATPPYIAKRRNRDIMRDILANPAVLTVEDIAQGQECRKFLQNDITFRALKNKLTEFDSSTSKVLAVTEEFDTVKNRLELAVVACLPASHVRALERQATQERVRQATGNYVAQPGNKVQLSVEIIKTNYSQQWNTWYATAITTDNCAVFFAYRTQLATGVQHTILGTVKAHRDGTTQLNRVSII